MRHRLFPRPLPKDAAPVTPVPLAHWHEVKATPGKPWRANCSCGWIGRPCTSWVDANTDGAAHVWNRPVG